jgi:hypothetical protein
MFGSGGSLMRARSSIRAIWRRAVRSDRIRHRLDRARGPCASCSLAAMPAVGCLTIDTVGSPSVSAANGKSNSIAILAGAARDASGAMPKARKHASLNVFFATASAGAQIC